MLTLVIGDKQFSSWSMRASIILMEKKMPYREVIAGLDWPIKFTKNGVVPIHAKEEYELPKEPASGCGCQITQLLNLDDTGLIKGSIVEHLPRVPTLIDTNTKVVICDVLAINEYLEENYKGYSTLLSENPVKRNDIRVFSSHIHADLLPLMSGISYANSFRKNETMNFTEEVEIQINETLLLIEKTLKRKNQKNWKGEFLFGEFSLADAMFSPIAQQLNGWKIAINNIEVKSYINALLNRDTIKSYLKEARKPYDLIQETVLNSPAWITRHYRYWPEINMIHNPENNIYHILDTIGKLLFEYAYLGSTKIEIASKIIKEYDVSQEAVLQDIEEFFEKIHPNREIDNTLKIVLN